MALRILVLAAGLAMAGAAPVQAQATAIDEVLSGVVHLRTTIDPEGRTVRNLGQAREGSGIVLDDSGLVLTIGYLIVEAYAAEVTTIDGRTVPADVIGYDHASGFGLLRATAPLNVRPLPLGRAGDLRERDPVIIAGHGGRQGAASAVVVSRREFAGTWEYLLDSAIYTSPPYPGWSGAALIDGEAKLVGVGSLFLQDVLGDGAGLRGNMFVPIDLLSPIFAELLMGGRALGDAKPWLGVSAEAVRGRLFVNRVTPGGPAEQAGLRRGDYIVGVAGEASRTLADFYRKVWALGGAGTTIPLDVQREEQTRRVEVRSANRLDHLKLQPTF